MNRTGKKNYALPIAVIFALFFMIAFVTGLQNPMAVIVREQFSTSNFLSQLGNFANFIAYAFMGIPAGMLLKRIGYKRTALTAIAVGFTGVGIMYLSGIAASFAIYLTGAFVSGFSMCMLNTVVNPLLNSLGSTQKRGNQLLQFAGACNSVGATIVPVLVGYLMGSSRTIESADPALWLAMGIFALAFAVLSAVKLPEPYVENTQSKAAGDRRGALSFRHFRLGIFAIFLYVGVEVGIPNITNLYMTDGLGISTTVAGTVIGTYWFLMLAGRLVGGAVGGRVSSRGMMTAVSAAALILVLLAIFMPSEIKVNMPVFREDISFGMENVPLSVMFLILCGLCTSVMWGAIFSLATVGLGRYTAMASGLFMMMVCGGGILPALQGLAADKAGYIDSYWIIAGCLVYMLYYAVAGSRSKGSCPA